jgi:hypothetical protein
MADKPAIAVRLTGDWKLFRFLISASRFEPALEAGLLRATQANALILRREIRLNIRGAKYAANRAPNAARTVFIKGSTKPLVDRGQLVQALTSQVQSYGRAEIGVSRMAREANVARIVHEGAIVPVTGKMRRMFRALSDVSRGKRDPSTLRGRAAALYARQKKGWKPLKESTTELRIPPRPFIREVVEDGRVQRMIWEN